jgi:hypothetical protein
MGLPKIVTPEYTIQLKSVKTPIRYRPYLVKEEKLFLTAKESADPKEMERAVLQVIKNCTFGELNVDILPTFDIEYLFLQLRAKSVNNVLDLRYECRNTLRDKSQRTSETDDGRCHNTVTLNVDINDIGIVTNEQHSTTVTLQSGLLVEMEYPSMTVVQAIQGLDETVGTADKVGQMLTASMKTITDAEGTTYEVRDYTDAERIEFIDELPVEDLRSFEAFFTTMPAVRSEVPFHCDKCEHDETITLQGLAAFFT